MSPAFALRGRLPHGNQNPEGIRAPVVYFDGVRVGILPDYTIQPVQPILAEDRALAGGELISRLSRGAGLPEGRHAAGAAQPVDSRQSTPAETASRQTGQAPSVDLSARAVKNEAQTRQQANPATRMQGEGQFDAQQIASLTAKLTQSVNGGDPVLTAEEQAAIKALLDQASTSGLARRLPGVSGQIPLTSTLASDINGIRLDGKTVQSLAQIFQQGAVFQAAAAPASPGGSRGADLILNGLASGFPLTAPGRGEALGGNFSASSLARTLAVHLAGGQDGQAIARRMLDLTFIRTTRQVAALLLTDQPSGSQVSRATAAMQSIDTSPPLNGVRLQTLMMTLQGIAPFLENGASGAALNRLGQWVNAIGNALAELENPSPAAASRNASLLNPGMRNLIARGFSFDLVYAPSVKVDKAIATLKANGFDALRITDTAAGTSYLRITVPGRDPKFSGPIRLDLHASTQTANAHQAQEPASLLADGAPVQGARMLREQAASQLIAHAVAEAAAATQDSDPIRQLGIPYNFAAHQLDPLLMGWAAFYPAVRPVNDAPADPIQSFRNATRTPLLLEYKPVEVISPGVSSGSAISDGILDVENFTAF